MRLGIFFLSPLPYDDYEVAFDVYIRIHTTALSSLLSPTLLAPLLRSFFSFSRLSRLFYLAFLFFFFSSSFLLLSLAYVPGKMAMDMGATEPVRRDLCPFACLSVCVCVCAVCCVCV